MKIISLLFLLVGIFSFGAMTIISLMQYNAIQTTLNINSDIHAKLLIFVMMVAAIGMMITSFKTFIKSTK